MTAANCATRMRGGLAVWHIFLAEMLQAELRRFRCRSAAMVTAEEFATPYRRPQASRIKALLLDQSVLRGVGNIYADESLWRAKIHPAKLGVNLGKKQLSELRRGLQKILEKAIAMRGSSIVRFYGC